jgi:hypothetical protein
VFTTALTAALTTAFGVAMLACFWAAPRAHAQMNPAPPSDAAEVARAHYRAGVDLYGKGRFEEALVELRAASSAFPTPNTRLATARTLVSLGRHVDAAFEYDATVTLAESLLAARPDYAATRDTAKRELASIARHIGRIRLDLEGAPPGTEVRIAGRAVPIPVAPGTTIAPWPVAPGLVVVDLSAPGHLPARMEVTVSPAGEATVRVALEPVPAAATEPRDNAAGQPAVDGGRLQASAAGPAAPEEASDGGGPWPVLAWTSGGIALAGVIGTVVFAVLTSGAESDYVKACVDAPCSDGKSESLASTGDTFATLTNVSLGVAIGGAALTALFVLLAIAGDDAEESPASARLGVGERGLLVSVSF